MINKILGGLMGVAVGDALGASTEFKSKDQIKEKYGYLTDIIGGGWLNLQPGEVTDDTEMTMCVAKGIIRNYQEPIKSIGEEFIEWFECHHPKDVGLQTRQVFQNYKGNWDEASKHVHLLNNGKSAGNGSLMRCLPIALAYRDSDKMEDYTISQSKLTHYDDLASEACFYYNCIAKRLLNNEELKSSIFTEVQDTQYKNSLEVEPSCPSDGYVVNTFHWVIYGLAHTSTFAEVVQYCANLGGDTDTIGAIAGGLAGIYYGYDGIPKEYADKILIKKEIIKTAENLLDLRLKNQ